MASHVDELVSRIAALEHELDEALSRSRDEWHYTIAAGRVRFERSVERAHRRLKKSVPRFLLESDLRNVLSAPIIYSLIVPIAIVDAWVSLYQLTCFPLYRIRLVPRSRYFVFDRQHLAYLNVIEKFNCLYCGYCNGAIAYVREIAGRTEQYWCPIRHATRVEGPHAHYVEFVDYGDAAAYPRELPDLRGELRKDPPAPNA